MADYRGLNVQTQHNSYTLPLTEEICNEVGLAPDGIGPKTDPSPPHTKHTLEVACSRSQGC